MANLNPHNELLERLKELVSEGKLTFFVGAGISRERPADSLDWRTFRNKLFSALLEDLGNHERITPENKQIYSEYLAYADLKPEVINQQIFWIIGEELLNSFAILQRGKPNKYHKLIARFAAQGKVRVIVTTNFDTYIEKALEMEGLKNNGDFFVAFDDESLGKLLPKLYTTDILIIKIHGTLIKDNSATTTRGIISTLLQAEMPLIGKKDEALKEIMSQNSLLVIGYSGNDSDIAPKLIEYARKGEDIYWCAYPGEKSPTIIERIDYIIGACKDKAHKFSMCSDRLFEVLHQNSWEIIQREDKLTEKNEEINSSVEIENFLGEWISSIHDYQLLLILAYVMEYIGQHDEALICVNKALEDVECLKDKKNLGTALHFKANHYGHKARISQRNAELAYKENHPNYALFRRETSGLFNEALSLYKKALKVLPDREFLEKGRICNNLGVLNLNLKKDRRARKNFKIGLKYLRRKPQELDHLKVPSKYEQATCIGNIGNSYIHSSIRKAIEHLQKSYYMYEDTANIGKIGPSIQLGRLYIQNARHSDAIDLFQRELDTFRNYRFIGNTLQVSQEMLDIGDIYFILKLDYWREFYEFAVEVVAKRALSALDSGNCSVVVESLAELWRLRERKMGDSIGKGGWTGLMEDTIAGNFPSSSSPLLDIVDEWVLKVVDKAKSRISNVNDPNLFFQWMKACVVAKARKQAASKRSSIEKEALEFAEYTGLSELPIMMFGPQAVGRECPNEILSPIISLIDNYEPELGALMITRRFPPPLAVTFMFTLREMNAVRPEYSEQAAALISFALCWVQKLAAAEHHLREIRDPQMRYAVRTKLNNLATSIGWDATVELFQ